MNEDEMAAVEPLAGEELERTLGRYARVRLDPSQGQRRRARSAVMEQAWRHRIDPTGSVAAVAAYPPMRRALFAGWTARRIAASLSAAVLVGLMVGSSVFAASRAGGPLYESRIALEALALPSDAAARVDAQLAQAQARLAEAVDATGRHDDRAAIAALDAYDAAIEQLTTAGGPSAERVRAAVQFHRSVLLEVAANAPAGAAGGLERALANSNRVIESLGNGAVNGNGNANAGGNGNANAGGKPVPASTAKPDATGEPTAKPGKTPPPHPNATAKPDKTPPPHPKATAKPDKTPPPHKTPDPGKPGASEERGQNPAPGGSHP